VHSTAYKVPIARTLYLAKAPGWTEHAPLRPRRDKEVPVPHSLQAITIHVHDIRSSMRYPPHGAGVHLVVLHCQVYSTWPSLTSHSAEPSFYVLPSQIAFLTCDVLQVQPQRGGRVLKTVGVTELDCLEHHPNSFTTLHTDSQRKGQLHHLSQHGHFQLTSTSNFSRTNDVKIGSRGITRGAVSLGQL
jgi:hypothetical protein